MSSDQPSSSRKKPGKRQQQPSQGDSQSAAKSRPTKARTTKPSAEAKPSSGAKPSRSPKSQPAKTRATKPATAKTSAAKTSRAPKSRPAKTRTTKPTAAKSAAAKPSRSPKSQPAKTRATKPTAAKTSRASKTHVDEPSHMRHPKSMSAKLGNPNALVSALGFIGVAVLVVLSVVVVRVVTNRQPGLSDAKTGWSAGTPATTAAYDPSRPSASEPISIDVMMIGDVLMHTEVTESGRQSDDTFNYDHLFEHIKDDISAADIRILNQETNLVTEDYGYGMVEDMYGPTFGTPQSLADTEAKYGFNVILKATNHTYDMGYDGLGCELDYWKSHHPDIPVIGVNNPNAKKDDSSQDYVNNVYVYDKDGFRVAIINHTFWTNRPGGDDDHAHMNFLEKDKIHEDVEKAKAAHADMIIACPHWGVEFETTPNDEEVKFAQVYADEGVDVILGGHPHILQPCVTLQRDDGHKTVCYYSAGNYVAANAMGGTLLVGGLDKVRLVKEPDGSCRVDSAQLEPLVIHRSTGKDMTTYPLRSYTDELAGTSEMPYITPAYVTSFVSELFGEGYDAEKAVYTVDMNKVTKI